MLGQARVCEPAWVTVASGCEQENPVGLDSPSNKRQHVGGRTVKPVRVVDDEQHWALGGDLRDDVEHGHASLASLVRGLTEQTRLPDTRLAAEHERLAMRCDLVQERCQEPLLAFATEKGRDLVTSRPEHERPILPLRARGDAAATAQWRRRHACNSPDRIASSIRW